MFIDYYCHQCKQDWVHHKTTSRGKPLRPMLRVPNKFLAVIDFVAQKKATRSPLHCHLAISCDIVAILPFLVTSSRPLEKRPQNICIGHWPYLGKKKATTRERDTTNKTWSSTYKCMRARERERERACITTFADANRQLLVLLPALSLSCPAVVINVRRPLNQYSPRAPNPLSKPWYTTRFINAYFYIYNLVLIHIL